MMRLFSAHVRNGRLVIELMRGDIHDGDPLDAQERAELARELEAAFAEEEARQLAEAPFAEEEARQLAEAPFDTVTDEHMRWYQDSMPDSPTTRDVIRAATSDVPVLRWLGRRRIAAAINARVELVLADDGGDLLDAEERAELGQSWRRCSTRRPPAS